MKRIRFSTIASPFLILALIFLMINNCFRNQSVKEEIQPSMVMDSLIWSEPEPLFDTTVMEAPMIKDANEFLSPRKELIRESKMRKVLMDTMERQQHTLDSLIKKKKALNREKR